MCVCECVEVCVCVTREGRDMIFDQTKHYEKTTVKLVFLFHVTTRKMDVGILAYMSHAFLVCMFHYCTITLHKLLSLHIDHADTRDYTHREG